MGLALDQDPVTMDALAVQLEALLEDHVSIVEPPAVTVAGTAFSETVSADDAGCVVGGGVSTAALSAPPPPQAARPNAHSNANDAP
jgi:hypothetical protein